MRTESQRRKFAGTRSRWLALVWSSAAVVGPLPAALEFSRTEIEVSPQAGERVLTAEYPFRNSGVAPVDVLDLTTSCGCLEATVAKRDIAPGASGVIQVRYTAGSSEGLQVQRVMVLTTADPAKPATLLFRAQLPRNAGVPQPGTAAEVTMAPAQLSWLKRPFETKSVTLDWTANLAAAQCTARVEPAGGFDWAVRHGPGERRAVIEVTPRDDVANGSAQLVVRVVDGAAVVSERTVSLRVLARKSGSP